MKTSLIISTYNRPDALRVCLDSIRLQTILPDEIVIGDDGSINETKDTIDAMRVDLGIPIKHVWHEDKGFQLAQMRNKSFDAASGDYIIEIDGDIMMNKHFIEDHLYAAQPGFYVKGGRVNLGKRLSEQICREGRSRKITPLSPGIESKRENGFRLKALALYLQRRYRKYSSVGLGCNMSFFKKDCIAINGYDNDYEGWGGEDIDFARRLQSYGLKKKYLKFSGIVYHLWHEDKYMHNKEKNFSRMRESQDQKLIRVPNGFEEVRGDYKIL
ncbi:glycosyltransferase family 2 protein [Porphyromonas pogonae]|uniref:glycosyltransferase family 2 protein n=1 Tax=Porphyromonas pogonae TaxID=867595 RepID=UPI002E7A9CE4|nr:glycosyltransferase family 2 protein [Porphyromonas pogonae]